MVMMMMMMVVMVVMVGGAPLSREKSRDVLEQPPPILAKARRLQLADASFRDYPVIHPQERW